MNGLTIEVKKVVSGLRYWDVIANGSLVQRFDTKWEAAELADALRVKMGL